MSNKNVTKNIIINNQLELPYIDTELSTRTMLYPNQMDNKIYLHLKTNLSNNLLDKCYQKYGYISKIYKINEISEGTIKDEDPSCSCEFIVRFNCRLFKPIENKEIICKIDRMNKVLISAINGPIKVIITPDKLNKDNFYSDINRNIRIKKNSNVVVPDMYIRVLVLKTDFNHNDKIILVIGYLQDMANAAEIEYFKNNNNDNNDNEN